MRIKVGAVIWSRVFIFLLLFTLSRGYIECYKCPVEPTEERPESFDCPAFNTSDTFKVRCWKSNFCEKKITHLRIRNGTTITRVVHRGCAPQNDPHHVIEGNREWKLQDNIQIDLYEPGCFQDIDKNSPTGPATYCYCRTHYCNGVSPIILNYYHLFILSLSLSLSLHSSFHFLIKCDLL